MMNRNYFASRAVFVAAQPIDLVSSSRRLAAKESGRNRQRCGKNARSNSVPAALTARKNSRTPNTGEKGQGRVELNSGAESSLSALEALTLAMSAPLAEPADRGEGASSSTLAAFLREAARVPLLTPQEEVALARRIRAGDEEARERMICANLRLVVKIARDYEHLGLPLLDLISEGAIGLMKAVERFNPAKGGKLSTYGSWWIKQQIRRALANQGRTIRLPVHVEGKLYRLGRAEVRLREVLGREPSDEELADELNMKPRRISRLREASVRPASLDATVGEDADGSLGELVADERASNPSEAFEQNSDRELMMRLLPRLPKREEMILRLRFGLNGGPEKTLEELGEEFGLTRERIRQLQNDAFRKLRELMESPDAEPKAA